MSKMDNFFLAGMLSFQACALNTDETHEIEVLPLGAYLVDEAKPLLARPSAAERSKMVSYLNTRTPPPAIKDAIVIGGRLFDCVEIHKQWGGIANSADDVPRSPEVSPSEDTQKTTVADNVSGPQPKSAMPSPSKPCPTGTVPMRHYELSELEKYTTLNGWLNRKNFRPQAALPTEDHEYAMRRDISR